MLVTVGELVGGLVDELVGGLVVVEDAIVDVVEETGGGIALGEPPPQPAANTTTITVPTAVAAHRFTFPLSPLQTPESRTNIG
ncbi:MAG: hypothetical protein ABSG81_04925 [Acidimicrobiales bacterium]